MRFVQVREGDTVVPGVIVDDSIVDLSAITAEIDGAFLGRDDLHEVVGTAIDSAPRLRLDSVHPLPVLIEQALAFLRA